MNFLDLDYRKKIIEQINGSENKERKKASLKEYEIFNDRLDQYVREYLRNQFSATTVREMPVVSSINLAKRIVTQEASIYRNEPKRDFSNVSDLEKETLNQIYSEMNFDAKMLKLNQIFKLQNQACLMIIPKNGELVARALYAHQYDVIPSVSDPEIAGAYVISSFDRSMYLPSQTSNGVNEEIADQDDYKSNERYIVWTPELHFVMDGNGKFITEETVSPLVEYGLMPFVDISAEKDFEFFVRNGHSLTDFAVQYCGALSDLGNIVKLQSYSQAWLSGAKELMPQSIVVGVNTILKLPIDPDNKVETKFGFASPNSDLAGASNYVEMILSNFLTSRGVDPKAITGKGDGQKFTSGVERFLSLIEKFEASRSDIALFRNAECQAFKLIKAWSDVYSGTEFLEKEYQLSLSEEADVFVKYAEPSLIQSKQEQVDSLQKEIELGLKSRIEAIAELRNVDLNKAKEIAQEIDLSLVMPMNQQGKPVVG